MTETRNTQVTPGYNCRLEIFFTTSKRGQRLAYRWSPRQFRAFRIPLDEAEIMRATETADVLPGHPMRELEQMARQGSIASAISAGTIRQTKAAWIRNPDVPPGQPALGHFDCPCGSQVNDVEFGAPDRACGSCGQVFDGHGWLL